MTMAISKPLFASVFVVLLLLHLVQSNQMIDEKTEVASPQNLDCGGACENRCQLSSRPRLCKRACGTCCSRCNCVPPGTAGNYEFCACYANLTTHGGRRKCP